MRRLWKVIGGSLVMFMTAATLVLVTSGPASAAYAALGPGKHFSGGPGHSGTVFAVKWRWGGKSGWCIDFSRHNPNGSGSSTISVVPGMNAEQSRRAMYLANTYEKTNNPDTAANVALAIWRIQNESSFNRWYGWAKGKGVITKARAAAVERLVNESKRHGPFKLTVKADAVLVGGTGRVTVTVRDASGRPAAGKVVALLSSGNAALRNRSVKTAGNGTAMTTAVRTNLGAVTFQATLKTPSSKHAFLTQPSVGSQRLLVGGLTDTASARTSYEKVLGKVAISSVCTENCEGKPPVTVKACTPAGTSPVRYTIIVNGTAVKVLDVATGKCATDTRVMADGDIVTINYCYLNKVGGSCTTKTVTLQTYEVICPPWLKVTFTGNCDCEGGTTLNLKLTAPGGKRFYSAVVAKNGATVATKQLGSNGTADVAVTLARGETATVTYTAWRASDYTGKLRADTVFNMKWF